MIRFYLAVDDDEDTHEILVPRQKDRHVAEATTAEGEPEHRTPLGGRG